MFRSSDNLKIFLALWLTVIKMTLKASKFHTHKTRSTHLFYIFSTRCCSFCSNDIKKYKIFSSFNVHFLVYSLCISTSHTFMMMMNQFTSKRKNFWDAAKQSSHTYIHTIRAKYYHMQISSCLLALLRVLHFSNIFVYNI